MDIELTSSRDDGNWTWRAAGALQPRGLIPDAMLGGHGRVGEVLRVEADLEMDGISIVAVLPSKGRSREPERIEILRPAPESFQPVTTALVGKDDRRGRGRDTWDGERAGGRSASQGRGGARPRADGGQGRPTTGPRALGRDGKPREAPTRERQPRDTQAREGGQELRRAPRPPSETTGRPSSPTGPARPPRPARPERPTRTRPPRLVIGNKHRDQLFATYPPEQRPIAEQLAQGGLAAVRRSLAEEQVAAKAEGRTVGNSEAIVAVAEQMLAGVREAVWLDRAEAAVGMLESISLRDLRSTVAAAAPRDEIGRELLNKLREALTTRVTKLRTNWEEEITKALDEDRVQQALRLSARPPEPTTRFPAGLVERLVTAAGASLSSSVPKDRWLALLDAASNSPVRRSIHPAGLPEDPDGSVRHAATEAAGRVPALAKLLGLAMPPPPRPTAHRPLPPRPPRPTARPTTPTSASPASTANAPVTPDDATPVAPEPPATPTPTATTPEPAAPATAETSVVIETAAPVELPEAADADDLVTAAPETPSEEAEPTSSPGLMVEAGETPGDDVEASSAPSESDTVTEDADAVVAAGETVAVEDVAETVLVEPLEDAEPVEPVAEPLAQAEEP